MFKYICAFFVLSQILLCNVSIANQWYDVAAYVWPAYQPEPRWKEFGLFKHGTGEWENVYTAVKKRPW